MKYKSFNGVFFQSKKNCLEYEKYTIILKKEKKERETIRTEIKSITKDWYDPKGKCFLYLKMLKSLSNDRVLSEFNSLIHRYRNCQYWIIRCQSDIEIIINKEKKEIFK